ncbi:hypothetical protein P3X46_009912 [Hevea brasiliensis]|uniref:TIR domain-containing protein n=1 Tax=Hevea brasiliensis TaxID=3981 RepID=A0ABQ9MEG3_HEVBR|nr:hypothetical protein P3X46_009912 [Hevea brasiliensis]
MAAPNVFSYSSSSSKPRWNHDVFLSFRGEDTRKNFTDHLYTSLIHAGISTFRDNDISRGENISLELLKAIHESRISIIVFSKGYASSRWCQIVIPIFYDVDPSDVRKQTGSFGEAFDRYKEFNEEIDKLKEWRGALMEAAELDGWDLQNAANGYESNFIQKVVEDVLRKLNCNYLNLAKHPVGIDSRVKEVIFLLSLDASNVNIVGIRGMGGIGKTTIAKALFNQLCHGFQGSCSFLSNVREVSEQPNGLVQLQKQLLHDTLKLGNFKNLSSVDSGIHLIKERLRYRRVFVVLDDLDQMKQVDALMGDRNWFGPGSRIIITTRNAHLLDQLEVVLQYEVRELNHEESLELFSWHAFKQIHPSNEYVKISNEVVDYVGGLPIALEVLGSYLCKRSIPEWRSAVEKLRKIPHQQIQKKLRISFDALDDDKIKDIFLDIACFFAGVDKDHVAKILDGCGLFPEIGIRVLIQRSLVKIDCWNRLVMHDLLRDMGREIVRVASPNHPGKRSRLWFHEDVLEVLKKHMGTDVVEGLMLDARASKDVFLSTESFAKMNHLRLLQINAVHLTGRQENLFQELRWLCWQECPLKSIPRRLQLDNLVVLEMQFSNIREIWKGIKVLKKLQILDLRHCVHLAKTPNFSGLIGLERLILEGCTSLVEVHQSIGCLKKLVFLNMEGCKSLKNLPESICYLKALETLNISGCSKLDRLPESLGSMEALTKLLVEGTAIKQLPSSIGHLKNLTTLLFRGSKDVSQSVSWLSQLASCFLSRSTNSKVLLPASLVGLTSLTQLFLHNCSLFEDVDPIDLGRLSSLKHLDLEENDFFNFPTGIQYLPKLVVLVLTSCRNLKSISELPSSLKFLWASNCASLERISLKSNGFLRMMFLSNSTKLAEIQGLEDMEQAIAIEMPSGRNSYANDFRKFLCQALSQGKPQAICLQSRELPMWLRYRGEGSSLSFRVPTVSEGNTEGLILWIVCAINDTTANVGVTTTCKSNSSTTWEMASDFSLVGACDDHSLLTYLPFQCAIESGEELEITVQAGANNVIKNSGVSLIYSNGHFWFEKRIEVSNSPQEICCFDKRNCKMPNMQLHDYLWYRR